MNHSDVNIMYAKGVCQFNIVTFSKVHPKQLAARCMIKMTDVVQVLFLPHNVIFRPHTLKTVKETNELMLGTVSKVHMQHVLVREPLTASPVNAV